MSKLHRLRKWLTLEDTATHLATALNEPVTVADVLRLGLDGHLVLSVYFPNGALAHLGDVIGIDETTRVVVPVEFTRRKVEPDAPINTTTIIIEDEVDEGKYIRWESNVHHIEGIWDLTMQAAERIDIEDEYLRQIGGQSLELLSLSGVFLKQGDIYARLVDRLPRDGQEQPMTLDRLPSDSMLVVRMALIVDFLQTVSDSPEKSASALTKEKNSYLSLIYTLMHSDKYDINKRGIATSLELATQNTTHPLTDDTIRKIISEVKDLMIS